MAFDGQVIWEENSCLFKSRAGPIYDKNSIHFPLKYSKQVQNDEVVS